ncbi:MAG: flippase [Candidatus Pacebacteria bacterium]|nr:flippase [Candidatus Paceibacterota bacterium]
MPKLDKFNLTQKIAYNAAFSTIARVLEMAIVFVTIKLTTTYLGVEGFGDYGTVLAFVYIFSVLADFGLYSIVVRDISLPDADESRIVSGALSIRLFLGAVILGAAYFFSLFFPYSEIVHTGILIAAAGYWFLNGVQVLMGVFQKHLLMDKVSMAEVMGRLVQFVGVYAAVKYDLGFLFIISTVFWGALLNFIIVIFYARQLVKIRLSLDWELWGDMLRRAFPLAVSAVLVLIYFKLDTIFLSVMKDSSAVGIYSLAYKIMENLIFFPSMLVGLTMPLMSRSAFTDRTQFKSIMQRTLDFLLVAIVPIVLGIFAVSDKLIMLLSKPEFRDAAPVLNILIVALAFIFLGALFSNVIIALKRQKSLAYIYLCGAIFNVVANFIVIPRYSYFGAAFSTLVTEFLVTALMVVVIYREIKFMPSFKNLLRTGAAGLLMFSVLSVLSFLDIFSMMIVGAVVYVSAAYLIGAVSKQEMEKLLHKRV